MEPVPITATTGCAGSMIFSLTTKWPDDKKMIKTRILILSCLYGNRQWLFAHGSTDMILDYHEDIRMA
jgi:hypothetical protein